VTARSAPPVSHAQPMKPCASCLIGLEFDHILIPNLSTESLPNPSLLSDCPDQVSRETLELQFRSLLHVGATRARRQVVITYSGDRSPYLPTSKALTEESTL
jgi:hypothetical protein